MERQQRWAWVISERCCRIWQMILFCSGLIRPPKSRIMKLQDSPLLHCPAGLGELRECGKHFDLDTQGENGKYVDCSDRGERSTIWWTERQERGLSIVAGCTCPREGPHRGWETLRLPRIVNLDLGSVMRVWAAWALSTQPCIQCLKREETKQQVKWQCNTLGTMSKVYNIKPSLLKNYQHGWSPDIHC